MSGADGSGTYAYDLLGRTTALPASDAPNSTLGDIGLTYFDNDLVRSMTQAGTVTTFTLDTLDRRSVETTTGPSGTAQVTRHYTDSSDNPGWSTNGTTTERYIDLIGGDLNLTVHGTSAELTLANGHGDIVTTVPLTASSSPAAAIEGWNSYEEYGAPALTNQTGTGNLHYGWVGDQQRETSDTGLMLMGARVYNSSTGLFTSVDPVEGGSSNDYAYPTDPVNTFDLDGEAFKMERGSRSMVSSGRASPNGRAAWLRGHQ